MSNCDVLGKSSSLGPSFLISNKLSDSLTSIYSHFLNQISEQSFLPDKEPESKLFKGVGPRSSFDSTINYKSEILMDMSPKLQYRL